MTTLRTFPAAVLGINRDDRDTLESGFIGDELTELSVLPVMQASTLTTTSGLNPVPNAREIFQGDSELVALRRLNDALGNIVVGILLKTSLLAAYLLQLPFSPSGAFLLQIAAAVGKLAAVKFQGFPGVIMALGIRGDVDYSEIDPQHPAGLDKLRVVNITNAGDIENALDQHQVHFTFAVLQKLSLILAALIGNCQPALHGPDGNGGIGFEAEYLMIVGLGGMGAESSDNLPIFFVGVRDLGDGADHHFSTKAKSLPGRFIGELMQAELLKNFMIPSLLRNPVAGGIGCFQSFPESGELLRGRG